MNDTTRRFPRTLQQAFPHDREWAYPIERYSRRTQQAANVMLACAIGIGLALALVHWWSA